MPAPFWGHLDPEREELTNALMRAQIRQAERAPELEERRLTLQEALLGEQVAGRETEMGIEAGREARSMRTMAVEQQKLMMPQYKTVGDMLVEIDPSTGQGRLLAEDPDTFENEYGIVQVTAEGRSNFIPWLNLKKDEYAQKNQLTGDMTIYKDDGTPVRTIPFMGFEPSSPAEMIQAKATWAEVGIKERGQQVKEKQLILNAQQLGINQAVAKSDIEKASAQIVHWQNSDLLGVQQFLVQKDLGYLSAENDALLTQLKGLEVRGDLASQMEANRIREKVADNNWKLEVMNYKLNAYLGEERVAQGWIGLTHEEKRLQLSEIDTMVNQTVRLGLLPLEQQDLISRIGSREFNDEMRVLELDYKKQSRLSLSAFQSATLADKREDRAQQAREFGISLNWDKEKFTTTHNRVVAQENFMNDLRENTDTREDQELALQIGVAEWERLRDTAYLDLAQLKFKHTELVDWAQIAVGEEANEIRRLRANTAERIADYEEVLARIEGNLMETRDKRLKTLVPYEIEEIEAKVAKAKVGLAGEIVPVSEQIADAKKEARAYVTSIYGAGQMLFATPKEVASREAAYLSAMESYLQQAYNWTPERFEELIAGPGVEIEIAPPPNLGRSDQNKLRKEVFKDIKSGGSEGKGRSRDEIKQMQSLLKKEGYYKGSITGLFGPETQAALTRLLREAPEKFISQEYMMNLFGGGR